MTREIHIMVHCDKCHTSKWIPPWKVKPMEPAPHSNVTEQIERDGWLCSGNPISDLCPNCKPQEGKP
jgi:hypothetical protein